MGQSIDHLGRVSRIPRRFCRGRSHHHQLGKGEKHEIEIIERTPLSLIISSKRLLDVEYIKRKPENVKLKHEFFLRRT